MGGRGPEGGPNGGLAGWRMPRRGRIAVGLQCPLPRKRRRLPRPRVLPRRHVERLRSNGSWRKQGLVFPNTLGGYADYTNLMPRHFKPLLRRAGLPDIRFHDLRHTCATLLLTKGVHPKIVSEMLGHSSVSITLDVYSHVIPGLGDAAALAMDEALRDATDD